MPWNEIETPADAWLIAETWLPLAAGPADPYWIKAARQLLADVLLAIPASTRCNGELYRCCVIAGNDELQTLLAGTVSGRLFASEAGERMRESIRNTLATELRALPFLDATARPGQGFSMRRWLRDSLASGDGRRVFLCCPPAQAAAIAPLIAIFIESAAAALLALGTDRNRRVGFLIGPPLIFSAIYDE